MAMPETENQRMSVRFARRQFIAALGAVAGATVLAACAPAAAPTAAPAKPADAPKAAEPTKPAAEAPKPTEAPKAAANPTTAPASAGGKKTFVFWQEGNAPSAEQGWTLLQKQFEDKQDKITIKRVFQADQNNIIKVALASDTGPDAFQRDIPPSYHQPLVDAKLVVAMDDYYKTLPNLQKVLPWAKKRATIAGKIWGVPHEVEFIPVFYNKGVWDKAGVKDIPTKSYDEFLATCKKFKDAGVQAVGLGARTKTQPGHIYSILAMLTTGKDGFEDILYGEGRWDKGGTLEAAEKLKELLDLGYLPKDVAAQEGPAVQAAFAAGKYAMWTTGSWSLQGFEDSKKSSPTFEYDYFIPPVANSTLQNPQIAGGIGGGFSIASKAKERDACAEWIDFLMSADAQKVWNEVFFQAAPTLFDVNAAKLPDVPKKAMGMISKGPDMGYNISVVIPANVADYYWNGLGGILSNQLSPKDWAAKMQVEWEKAKKDGLVLKP